LPGPPRQRPGHGHWSHARIGDELEESRRLQHLHVAVPAAPLCCSLHGPSTAQYRGCPTCCILGAAHSLWSSSTCRVCALDIVRCCLQRPHQARLWCWQPSVKAAAGRCSLCLPQPPAAGPVLHCSSTSPPWGKENSGTGVGRCSMPTRLCCGSLGCGAFADACHPLVIISACSCSCQVVGNHTTALPHQKHMHL
jgi:hypothetical protein